MEHTVNYDWTVLPYQRYILNLLPPNFHLFGLMKNELRGRRFPGNDAVITAGKSRALPLVLIFTNATCRLLPTASKKA